MKVAENISQSRLRTVLNYHIEDSSLSVSNIHFFLHVNIYRRSICNQFLSRIEEKSLLGACWIEFDVSLENTFNVFLYLFLLSFFSQAQHSQ